MSSSTPTPDPADSSFVYVESMTSVSPTGVGEAILDENQSAIPVSVDPRSSGTKSRARWFWDIALARGRALLRIGKKFSFFVGPGAMVSVAYIDPGNYSTGISAGASFRYDLLCVVFIANVLAIFLQTLCLRLGTVTGRDLAQNSRERFPRWLNIIDVVIILFFYNRTGSSISRTQIFELGVASLVIGVTVCFSIELSKIQSVSVGDVFHGFLPSGTMIHGRGLYVSCGIIGATVMPHSLFLGSGLVQTRLRDYDIRHGIYIPSPYSKHTQSQSTSLVDRPTSLEIEIEEAKYRPSLAAIRNALPYSVAELVIALGTFALFINISIIVVSGATLYNTPSAENADLFSIYDLLKTQLSTGAATVFALALLMSGQSAGLVATLAGQIVSEGYLRWNITPWLRRLITRTISVIPCIIVASTFGRSGIASVLNATQVALSVILPFATAPLVYFTCRKDVMSVSDPLVETLDSVPVATTTTTTSRRRSAAPADNDGSSTVEQGRGREKKVDFSNSVFVAILAVIAWMFIAGLNSYLIVALATHKTG
ncbi:hypothetical protein BS47DRAFT_1377964 [Hydnum rufescens UP504]|uniref:Natural resistance-associated macrophage protein n=1 Tax=Hydnum rufescens UP504 TaxID=1448309 RepID=A0A9P6DLS0_9AGAM|nr:hypothetical protein BS47DRAFT_1377964 [Hydnum rufescens UP504]